MPAISGILHPRLSQGSIFSHRWWSNSLFLHYSYTFYLTKLLTMFAMLSTFMSTRQALASQSYSDSTLILSTILSNVNSVVREKRAGNEGNTYVLIAKSQESMHAWWVTICRRIQISLLVRWKGFSVDKLQWENNSVWDKFVSSSGKLPVKSWVWTYGLRKNF